MQNKEMNEHVLNHVACSRHDPILQEQDRAELMLALIRGKLLECDAQDACPSAEFDPQDLSIWRALQEDGATCQGVASKMGCSVGKVSRTRARIEDGIGRQARALLEKLAPTSRFVNN